MSTTSQSEPTPAADAASRDRAILELQTSRNLQKLVSSIERFLVNQIDRLESAMQETDKIAHQGEVVQRLRIELEEQKAAWHKEREAEAKLLNEERAKLARGLRQLEDAQANR